MNTNSSSNFKILTSTSNFVSELSNYGGASTKKTKTDNSNESDESDDDFDSSSLSSISSDSDSSISFGESGAPKSKKVINKKVNVVSTNQNIYKNKRRGKKNYLITDSMVTTK
jgi:hypothetical protein